MFSCLYITIYIHTYTYLSITTYVRVFIYYYIHVYTYLFFTTYYFMRIYIYLLLHVNTYLFIHWLITFIRYYFLSKINVRITIKLPYSNTSNKPKPNATYNQRCALLHLFYNESFRKKNIYCTLDPRQVSKQMR